MMLLESIDLNKVCSIDIETVTIYDSYENADDTTKQAWELKFREEFLSNPESLQKLYTDKAPFYAEFSKICAVSISTVIEGKMYTKCFYGDDELKILEDTAAALKKIYVKGGYRLVGHNAKFFDYPFLCKRFMINGLPIPGILDTSHMKPWEQFNLDTNELWRFGGTGPGGSLLAVCNALNIESSKTDLTGNEVGNLYRQGEFEKIGKYCSQDSIATLNILRRLAGERAIYDFVIEDTKEQTGEESIILELAVSQKFTLEIQKTLKHFLNGKNPQKEDYDFLKYILECALLNLDFKGGDSKVVQAVKKDAIVEFLNKLEWN